MNSVVINERVPGNDEIARSGRIVKITAGHGLGAGWLAGWLFTVGFAHLVWWKSLLGLAVWPLFLGSALG